MLQTFVFNGQPHERAGAEMAIFGHSLNEDDYADLGGDLLRDAQIAMWYDQS